MKRITIFTGLLVIVCTRCLLADPPEPPPPDGAAILFEREVRPILTAHCWKCHGLESRKAGLDLRSVPFLMKGGDSGPAIVRGSSAQSLLHQRIADGSMPPKGELPLSAEQIETLRRWIDSGAATRIVDEPPPSEAPLVSDADRKFWAFQPPVRQTAPIAKWADRVGTPVDAFLLAKLEGRSLGFSHDADPRTLVTRLSLDLIGVPPTPEEIQAFVDDDAQEGYDRLVDRLLDSPHFGERWARHWLDVVGYADTIGDDTDAAITKLAAGKWRYRDYVIRAFNDDQPYDRFLIEQFAGDELFDWRSADTFTPEQKDLLIATGFLRAAADETLQNELNTADIRHAVLQGTMETALSGVLGLTVGCARCHSHKYDPIPHEDYYRLLSVFSPAFNPQSWLQPAARELADVPPVERKRREEHNAALDKQIAECRSQLAALRKPFEERLFAEKLAALPEEIRAECKAAIETPADKRSDRQKELVAKHGAMLKVSPQEVRAAQSENDRAADQALEDKIAGHSAQKQSWETLQVVYDVESPAPTYLLLRGNHETPGREVNPGFLRALSPSDAGATLQCAAPHRGATGRRLALATRLTAAGSPSRGLVARVFVNRLWQQLFGRGIVATPENFGSSGVRPTHPELLDWLAVEFIDSGWRIKPLLRLLVTSTAYRQSSGRGTQDRHAAEANDPDNSLWWRMPLRPLEAEIVRDRILATSGLLNSSFGGPPILHTPGEDGIVRIKADSLPHPAAAWRRSVYLLSRRRYHLALFDTFDRPEVTGACLQRRQAPAVAQSLLLLNDPVLHEQSTAFADRVRRESLSESQRDQIDRTFLIALGRPPTTDETTWATELIDGHRQRYRAAGKSDEAARNFALGHLCRALWNVSEFLYVP